MCKVFHCTISLLPFFSSLFFSKLLGGSSLCKVQILCVLKLVSYQLALQCTVETRLFLSSFEVVINIRKILLLF